eukprot:CAMPEP_0179297870 /NCGR_PEP_ID=MMETSP0797-20121207/45693_1 /TAXON_ID=47934 /ORGANISM="Dinophysis acuminata, Strain DAEP01" /LENGTH=131 /DNA_ID=CAMNT_0021007225 /DNA_START=231 /DNA_END=624 /DNA_ORIENTATION=+
MVGNLGGVGSRISLASLMCGAFAAAHPNCTLRRACAARSPRENGGGARAPQHTANDPGPPAAEPPAPMPPPSHFRKVQKPRGRLHGRMWHKTMSPCGNTLKNTLISLMCGFFAAARPNCTGLLRLPPPPPK